mgnify:CR=1 FL=1|jgi:hypothetical protein
MVSGRIIHDSNGYYSDIFTWHPINTQAQKPDRNLAPTNKMWGIDWPVRFIAHILTHHPKV